MIEPHPDERPDPHPVDHPLVDVEPALYADEQFDDFRWLHVDRIRSGRRDVNWARPGFFGSGGELSPSLPLVRAPSRTRRTKARREERPRAGAS